MKKIGFFWGSTSDNTKIASEFMIDYLEGKGFEVDSYDIADIEVDKMLEYDNLIVGCPTWDIGELQSDWDSVYLDYEKLDFEGKIGAFYACGDQTGYPDNFLDSIGILGRAFMETGGKIIGRCSKEPYDFRESLALDNDELLGLGLDYDNEDEEFNEDLMKNWLDKIIDKF
ncbi:MAG: flavodoxin FldA [Pelagibacteraceae bacterium TMED124]|nr:flavodoxin FldA [Candidatus Neomarinimicrobiota bacterium]RPG19116.1 MAG: flavodoxin FldA [Pelagibacteraceae bacterium TMED124]|tara:strand:+ start:17670 stop:18182 length:513 start_codon:yes stop_codon:yes gene_type:complete